MTETFPGRIHGDGRLIIDESFYAPVPAEDIPAYKETLDQIIQKAGIDMGIEQEDPDFASTLLALKQRFMVGFSNGCPWPEKAIGEYLKEHATSSMTLRQLADFITESATEDGKHSFLFQNLLANASAPLKQELLSFHPWVPMKGQEDHHLPNDITDPPSLGKGAYGLAYDPPYFDVLIPLYSYIEDETRGWNHETRYFAVSDFLEKESEHTFSISDLIDKTKRFLENPQPYVEPYGTSPTIEETF